MATSNLASQPQQDIKTKCPVPHFKNNVREEEKIKDT